MRGAVCRLHGYRLSAVSHRPKKKLTAKQERTKNSNAQKVKALKASKAAGNKQSSGTKDLTLGTAKKRLKGRAGKLKRAEKRSGA